MENPIIHKEQSQPAVPGIGVAGMVLCPLKQFPQACIKQGCEWWVELNYGDKKVGRCAIAWGVIVNVEIRQELEHLRRAIGSPKFIPDKPLKDEGVK